MFPYRCETFTTANVSVLNVFKTSVDTINASSITSDMTIGANLNGGSLTLGAAGATTSINSNITNVATGGLTGSGRVNIGSGTNLDGSQINIGSSTLYQTYIRAKILNINDIGNTTTSIGTGGLSGSDRVFIASGANAVGSEMYLGSTSLYQSFIRGTLINIADNGGEVFIAGGGLAANKRIRIGNGTNGTDTEVHLGSETLARLYIKGKDIALNDSDNGNIFLGWQNNSATSKIQLNRPLTIGYTSAPTTSQIGGISSVFNASGLPLTTSPFVYPVINTNGLPLGNYIGTCHYFLSPSVATEKIAFQAQSSSGLTLVGANEISYNASGTSGDGVYNNLVFFFTVTNATTSSITFALYSAFANSTITVCTLYAMRIG